MSSKTTQPFRFWSFFFSLQGRVSRQAIWYFVLPVKAGLWGAHRYLTSLPPVKYSVDTILKTPFFLANLAISLIGLLTLWPIFALLFKRLHDVGWRGWPALPVFYPLIYAIGTITFITVSQTRIPPFPVPVRYLFTGLSYYPLALAILLALVPGRTGSNRYGPPPKGETSEAAQHF